MVFIIIKRSVFGNKFLFGFNCDITNQTSTVEDAYARKMTISYNVNVIYSITISPSWTSKLSIYYNNEVRKDKNVIILQRKVF